jgi:hypothetical protein
VNDLYDLLLLLLVLGLRDPAIHFECLPGPKCPLLLQTALDIVQLLPTRVLPLLIRDIGLITTVRVGCICWLMKAQLDFYGRVLRSLYNSWLRGYLQIF